MVSRRNFLTITLIMLALLFLFLTPEALRERMYDYGSNSYAGTQNTEWKQNSAVSAVKEDINRSGRYIVYIGDVQDSATGSTVRQWCAYSKRYLQSYSRLGAYEYRAGQMPEAVVIDSDDLDGKEDTGALEALVQQGVHLIFCGLPDLEQLKKNTRLKSLMGIRSILSDGIQVQGIHLFGGLLLGGEKIYQLDDTMEESKQDLDLEIPWCQPASGTKTYMAGMMDDSVKNEELPAVIWRNSIGQARIFVVNGDYISGNSGMGFLEGMLYETRSYALYPVINAQNLVVLNYPLLASENEAEMMRLYSRKPEAVFRDLVWPGLAVTLEKSQKKLTCMLAPQQDYTDGLEPDADRLVSYMKLLQERSGEAGISASVRKVDTFNEKLNQDKILYNKIVPKYAFLSFYQDRLTDQEAGRALHNDLLGNVRTVFADYEELEPVVSYQNADVTRQCATDDGWSDQTFSENIRLNSIETALGYSSIAVDMNRIAYPQSEEDTWENLYDRFAGNVNTYWKDYEGFAATTLSESDTRIRRFLALDYVQERSKDVITLELEHFEEEAYFILRLHGELVKEMQGAEYEMVQDGVYLIEARQEEVRIVLGEEARVFYD